MSAEEWQKLVPLFPELVTAGGAEALAVKAVRLVKTGSHKPEGALLHVFESSRPPIPVETLKFQMRLAVDEATESTFISDAVRATLV
jgi:hypothetical protein